MTDLLTQLNDLIRNAEANQAAADNWRNLVAMLAERGYGPRILPDQIADLVPDILLLTAVAATTQEAPAPESTKRSSMPRRRLTDEDKQWIDQALAAGSTAREIARQYNLAPTSVEQYINDRV